VTRAEWDSVVQRMVACWPHYDWPNAQVVGSLDVWFEEVDDLDADQVRVACRTLYRSGREFPPNGAQVRAQVVSLAADLPGFGEVWDRLHRAASNFGQVRSEEAIAWLAEWHPLAGEFARILTFREFCLTTEQEVFHGQARRTWDQLVRRHDRDSQVAGLPSAGLRAVERANEPRQIGDVLAGELPAPAEERVA